MCKGFQDPDRVIEANGRALLAAGIDPCCHLASPGQSLARLIGDVPCPAEIGRTYARMGYAHIHHPFMTLLTAGMVRHTLDLVPFVDTSSSVALDLRDMGSSIRSGNPDLFRRLARALIHFTGASGLFLPFPFLRHKQRHYMHKNLSAKKVLSFLSLFEDPPLSPIILWGMPGLLENEIPDPGRFHISCLGLALDSEESLERAKAFLSAGGSADLGLNTGRNQLVVESIEEVPAGSLSMDAGLHHPLCYRFQEFPLEQNPSKAGWSLMEQAVPSWKLSLSASGLAGGLPTRLPEISTWLLGCGSRPAGLAGIFTNENLDLFEYARLTRLEPARFLKLSDSGHVKPGARANVALYDIGEKMTADRMRSALSDCWCLIKDGVVVREQGAFTGAVPPTEIRCHTVDEDVSALSQTDLLQNPTLRLENLMVVEEP